MEDLQFLDGSFRKSVDVIEAPRMPQFEKQLEDVPQPPPFPEYPPKEYLMGPLPRPQPPQQATMLPQPQVRSYLHLNCIDVANHIDECPVCSKLHQSHSNVFIGIIIALLIIILFLGKRFFE